MFMYHIQKSGCHSEYVQQLECSCSIRSLVIFHHSVQELECSCNIFLSLAALSIVFGS